MTNYLIPYVDPKKFKGHMDAVLEEFSYGNIRQRGKVLRHNIGKGSFLFFHIGKIRPLARRCLRAQSECE